MLAWRTELWGIESIVKAPTRAAARAATIRCARSAEYDVPWLTHVRVRRAPEYDAAPVPPSKCWSPDHAEWARTYALSEGLGHG